MGNSVYRRGAPILAVGAVVSAMVVGGIAWAAHAEKALAPPPKSQATTTSEFANLPESDVPPPIEPLPKPGDPKTMRVPVVTEPAGAAVYEVDGGRRRMLCEKTPCDITVWKNRIDQMTVSLELNGFDSARAQIKDVAEVPGGSLQMVFTRRYTGPSLHTYGPAPTLRQGMTQVEGRLPPEVIQRIVRQNFGRFRLCYENALIHTPTLQGRVVAKFVIGRDGSVTTVQDGGSDIGDGTMSQCVIRGFANLSFPMPEDGVVRVTYPIIFNPSEVPRL